MSKFRYSIRTKVIFVLLFVSVSMVGAILFFNSTMLEKFYMTDKKNSFVQTYDKVNFCSDEFSAGTIDESSYQQRLEQLSSQTNISILVIQSDWSTAFASMRNLENFKRRLQDSLFHQVFEDPLTEQQNTEDVYESENYKIQRVYDRTLEDSFMELYGTLNNGNMVYMSIAIKSIQDNVEISNRFIWMSGMVLALVSLIAALALGNYITKPILGLTEVAKRMSELDFNARYEGVDKGELGILGNSMNELSQKLETTISDLKQANVELQKDIANKEQIEERRKEFIANVSHELKTPIAVIQGYAEGLKEGINDDAESREFYCDVIMDEARKMNEMVKNLLNLSHIESGNIELDIERFDIAQLLNGVIEAKKLLAMQNGCEIINEATEPCMVWADESSIEEVVVNYLTNAINHCEGEKKIIVRSLKEGDNVRIMVFNTGKQIPEEELDKIWLKFYKVDKARTRTYGGNGIGLSIVKAIMDLHGKQCGVSNVENGVMFWFTVDATT